MAMDRNLQGARRRGRLKQTWKGTIMEEARKCGKTWNQIRDWQGNRVRWRFFINV